MYFDVSETGNRCIGNKLILVYRKPVYVSPDSRDVITMQFVSTFSSKFLDRQQIGIDHNCAAT